MTFIGYSYKIRLLNALWGGIMENIKYACPQCGYESKIPDLCPHCKKPLVATCMVCGNPIVGEPIHPED